MAFTSSAPVRSPHPLFNPFDADFRRNPYPTFARLQHQDPVHKSLLGAWTLTRYAEVKAVLQDKTVGSVDIPTGINRKSQTLTKKGQNAQQLYHLSQDFLFFLDPPDHTRLRNLVLPVFNPGVVENLRPFVEQITTEMVRDLRKQTQPDAIAHCAVLIPGLTVCQLMGLPLEDQPQLHRWATVLFRLFDPLRSLKECQQMEQVTREFVAYFHAAITQRRQAPQRDLLSDLIHAQHQGERLTEAEIIHLCIMSFVAGEQTTIAALGNGILALLNHPEQLDLLRRQPEMAPSAAEEIFRYESPTQYVMRVATTEMTLGEKAIAPGEQFVLCLGAANRDPAQFPEPERFDIQRKPNSHLAFAAGRHFCIGAGLARLEVPIVLNGLLQGLPEFSPIHQALDWRENIVLRSLRSLPLQWS